MPSATVGCGEEQEAAVVLAGGAGRVLQMTSATQAQLWEGVQGGDMSAVAAVAAQLGLPPADGAARLPVRVVVLSPGAQAAASAFFVPTRNTSALLRPAALHRYICRIILQGQVRAACRISSVDILGGASVQSQI